MSDSPINPKRILHEDGRYLVCVIDTALTKGQVPLCLRAPLEPEEVDISCNIKKLLKEQWGDPDE